MCLSKMLKEDVATAVMELIQTHGAQVATSLRSDQGLFVFRDQVLVTRLREHLVAVMIASVVMASVAASVAAFACAGSWHVKPSRTEFHSATFLNHPLV